jgi:hypothetical protein
MRDHSLQSSWKGVAPRCRLRLQMQEASGS